jgi:hypothetical protein
VAAARWPHSPPGRSRYRILDIVPRKILGRAGRGRRTSGEDETVTSRFDELPPAAAWRHEGFRDGHEVVFVEALPGGCLLNGCTTAVEEGEPWTVGYEIAVDDAWRAISARVWSRSRAGRFEIYVESDGSERWRIDGAAAGHLDGCVDIDLESSAVTNTLPVHRLALSVGAEGESPAVYLRALDLVVERLDQRYHRVDADDPAQPRFRYTAPRFDYDDELVYDSSGLVVRYPGIATRIR